MKSITTIPELAAIFLRLGLTAFGGPAAHIAFMRKEFVQERGWLEEAEFVDILGTASVIPGPSSTEAAMLIGMRCCGIAGLWTAGICFILPAALLVGLLAAGYVQLGRLPSVQALFYGVEPIVTAIVAHAIWGLGRTALKTSWQKAASTVAFLLAYAGVSPFLIVFVIGSLFGMYEVISSPSGRRLQNAAKLVIVVILLLSIPLTVTAFLHIQYTHSLRAMLFCEFARIGSIVYGSGYVLVVFLHRELITKLHWITEKELLNAIAAGQITPGPVFTTAAFLGFLKFSTEGALLAVAGIFLPAFFFAMLGSRLLAYVKQTPTLRCFLDGVNAVSIALMANVVIQFMRATLTGPLPAILTLSAYVLLLRTRINSLWLMAGGAAAGIAVTLPGFLHH